MPERTAQQLADVWDQALSWLAARNWEPSRRIPIGELLAAEEANPYRTVVPVAEQVSDGYRFDLVRDACGDDEIEMGLDCA